VASEQTKPVESLYVHVPFCAAKCQYCAFYSEASTGERIQRYVDALVRELELVAPDLNLTTVFFGGGTPSLLNLRQWQHVFGAMERLGLLGAEEWTLECNPATVSLDKARLWREYGVNRVSLGVQSLDERLLHRLGRVHTRAMVIKSFDLLRRGGFENVNLDLMFAIPGQTRATWRRTLEEALALGSEHLSSYEVTYEEDTPLFAQRQAGEFEVDEGLACDMYEELLDRASAHGFEQYEVSNFARRERRTGLPPVLPQSAEHGDDARLRAGAELFHSRDRRDACPTFCDVPMLACRHNINYWRGGSYYGLGPSAAGNVRGVRTRNWSNTQLYCEALERGRRAIESTEELPPLRRASETAAFGLRMNAGWPFALFQRTTGFDLREQWAPEMSQLAEKGWARRDPHRFQLTATGMRFADAAAECFLR
jgi:oxygen-independent coproporphyrinogen-3 oxidase